MCWNAILPVVSPRAATKSALEGSMRAPTADPNAITPFCQDFKGALGGANDEVDGDGGDDEVDDDDDDDDEDDDGTSLFSNP